MKSIVWLASYPKSGNTWLRIFLENLFFGTDAPCDINNLRSSFMSCSLDLFDRECGWDVSLLSHDEIDRLRPEIYTYIDSQWESVKYFKTHCAYSFTGSGEAFFPDKVTKAAIYLIRNPLDVCISYAHHRGYSDYDRIIAEMADVAGCLCSDTGQPFWQARQKILSWSLNVESWLSVEGFPVLFLRYEDMKNNPYEAFSRVVAHLGVNKSEFEIRQAIKNSSFEELQKQESLNSFKEKPSGSNKFFRSGQNGMGYTMLSRSQAASIIANHGQVMAQFGYL
jgi:hypothetical protein